MDTKSFIIEILILFATGYYLVTPNPYDLKAFMLILFLITSYLMIRRLYKNYKEKGRLI